MKRAAYLINTVRALICDRDAVGRALQSGQLAGYAGDMSFPQPAPADHPWRTMPHRDMTPHVSGSSMAARSQASGTVVHGQRLVHVAVCRARAARHTATAAR